MDGMICAYELPCDGERFLPKKMGGVIALEHWHRYLFASQFVAGKDVLDIASGEGYGSASLAKLAHTVVGVDISPDAVAHAREAYECNNLKYLVGKCEAIPIGNHSVDVVVSFETIEHLEDHHAMMAEIKRVLRPGGLLIISSPNKQEYSDTPGVSNPFHLKELYKHEFKNLMSKYFCNISTYGQRVLSGSMIEGEIASSGLDYSDIDDLNAAKVINLPKPIYFVALGSDECLPKPSASILEKDIDALVAELNDFRNSAVTKVIHTIVRRDSEVLQEALHSKWYLDRNPDLIQAQVDPVEHWFSNGCTEGRIPSSNSTQLIQGILDERSQALKAEMALLLEELARMRSLQPIDVRKLEAEVERTRLRGRYEIEAVMRQMLQREEAFNAQILHLQRDAEARQAELRQVARQDLEILTKRHAEQEEQLRTEIAQRESELQSLQREVLERQRAQEAELAQARQEAREEQEAYLHRLAEREQVFSEKILQLHREAESKEADFQLLARQDFEALVQRHTEQEEQLCAEVARAKNELGDLQREMLQQQQVQEVALALSRQEAKKELEAHLHRLAEREQVFSEKILQLHREAESKEADFQLAARQDLDALAQRHTEQEEQLRAEISQRESKLYELQREALDRQQALQAELAQTRQESWEKQKVQLQKLAEREQVFGNQVLQLHRQVETVQQAMKAELDAICATRSWRWTLPFRRISQWFCKCKVSVPADS